MTINQVILGVLSFGSYTGYDLKKIIADNDILPWSGNNNQIYKALLELKDDGFVTSESILQDTAPNKKVYSLSVSGRDELRTWLLDETKLPEIDHPLLAKLLFAGVLLPAELAAMLDAYRLELQGRQKAQSARLAKNTLSELGRPQQVSSGCIEPDLSDKIQRMISKYLSDQVSSELSLVDHLLKIVKAQSIVIKPENQSPEELAVQQPESVASRPTVIPAADQSVLTGVAMTRNGNRYIEISATSPAVTMESDVVDLLAFCSQHETRRLLIASNVFADDFFRLKTGLAGMILQKLANYHVRAALIRSEEQKIKGKFYDFLLETNRGQSFRIFDDREAATDWLCK